MPAQGSYLLEQLRELQAETTSSEVRGQGSMAAVEFVQPGGREPGTKRRRILQRSLSTADC
jgi:4-aminobutyrate aminotransferase-like enzyme